MKIGIVGLPQVGKKTLFELLTNHRLTEKDLASNKPIIGSSEIKDGRFDALRAVYKPKKEMRARFEIELIPKLEKETLVKGTLAAELNSLDGILHVVRAFKDDSVYHIEGSVDPKRDIDFVNSEFMLGDLIFIEKRLEKLEKTIKQTGEEALAKERELLLKLKTHLDKTLPLRSLDLTSTERKAISSYYLMTLKTMMLVLNISENALKDMTLVNQLKCELAPWKTEVAQIAAKAESEIEALESEEEKKEFRGEIGIEKPAIKILTDFFLKALGLISFFTVTHGELRQWTIKRGSSAPEAAGLIHSDLQRGFIRAEIVKYEDLVNLGSEEKVKEAGRFYVKGKDYIIEDGDIAHIRFNI